MLPSYLRSVFIVASTPSFFPVPSLFLLLSSACPLAPSFPAVPTSSSVRIVLPQLVLQPARLSKSGGDRKSAPTPTRNSRNRCTAEKWSVSHDATWDPLLPGGRRRRFGMSRHQNRSFAFLAKQERTRGNRSIRETNFSLRQDTTRILTHLLRFRINQIISRNRFAINQTYSRGSVRVPSMRSSLSMCTP